jgi:CheY-like chemotaxis protein
MSSSAERVPSGGLILVDAHGVVLFCTENLADRLGCSCAGAIGRPVSEVLPAVEGALPGMTLHDGRIELRKVPLGDGSVSAQLCIVRHTAEGGAPLQGGLAIEALPEIARLTHDLNNVFTVIYAAVDMALKPGMDPADVRESLEDAQKASHRGAQFVTRIRQLIGREPGPASHDKPDAVFAHSDGHERVLVVSGDGSTRILLRAVLGYRGYDVVEADNFNAALRFVDTSPSVRLVVGDVAAGTACEWESLGSRVPVLVLGEENSPALHESPAVNWFAKPFDNTALAARVRELLNARGQE